MVNELGKCGKTIAIMYELTKRTQEKLFANRPFYSCRLSILAFE